jgi:hypothetical protein
MAFGWDPEDFKAGSNLKKTWKGICGHIWTARVADVVQGSGCPYCSGKNVLYGFNDLKTTHPVLSEQAVGWNPENYSAGSHKKVDWDCASGHRYQAPIKSRALQNSGCPVCAGKIVIVGFNDLRTVNSEIASQAFGWDPSQVTFASDKKFQWKCLLGHIWTASVASRTVGGRKKDGFGCPFCSGKRVSPGFNDLATKFPVIASQAYGWDPIQVTSGSRKKLKWKCELGHSWNAVVADRTGAHSSGCPYCTNQKVLAGFNDLATTRPELAAQLVSADPKTIIAGTNQKVKWKCQKGHFWVASVHSRASLIQGRGCPTCADSGFDPNEDGYLYFINHPNWLMLQIGITNVPDKRIASHTNLGWELLELRGPMDGHITRQWETAILRMLKAKGADLSNSKIAGRFDGYSEAWSKSTFEVKSIKELMRLTEEFENN